MIGSNSLNQAFLWHWRSATKIQSLVIFSQCFGNLGEPQIEGLRTKTQFISRQHLSLVMPTLDSVLVVRGFRITSMVQSVSPLPFLSTHRSCRQPSFLKVRLLILEETNRFPYPYPSSGIHGSRLAADVVRDGDVRSQRVSPNSGRGHRASSRKPRLCSAHGHADDPVPRAAGLQAGPIARQT